MFHSWDLLFFHGGDILIIGRSPVLLMQIENGLS